MYNQKNIYNELRSKLKLTERQAEISVLVSIGQSDKEISDILGIQTKTVKTHLKNIYKSTNIKSRAQLIVWCMPYTNIDNIIINA
jgi:DNA-binding CsgD family transcriptional regulator